MSRIMYKTDPFIQKLHAMCRKEDIVMNQLIAGTISWADVPSDDDDVLELEGWRAYAKVEMHAKSAYHRTMRDRKHGQRATSKQRPLGRIPYCIMKQEQTKHVLSHGRLTPVKEILDVVIQAPVDYEEADMEFITQDTFVEKLAEKLVEKPAEKEEYVNTSMDMQENVQIVTSVELPTLIKRPNKEKFIKKKKNPTPVMYEPTFKDLYILPLLPYLYAAFLIMMISTMRL